MGKTYRNPRISFFNKGKHYSVKTEIKKGQRLSPKTEFKRGQRISLKTEFKKGHAPWLKGKTKSEDNRIAQPWLGKERDQETRDKISKAKRGKRSASWKGGTRRYRKMEMGRYQYIEWRSFVFERDKYTCQDCGEKGGYLHAHHIKSWARYPKLRYELNNGITYCKECHANHDKHYAHFYKYIN